jgi:hypothetical protein
MEENTDKKKINRVDEILMNPVEKYEKLGKFPLKMTIHILLAILTVTQVILTIQSMTSYSRSQVRFLYNLFLDNDDKTGNSYNQVVYIYTIEELKEKIKTSYNVK